MLRIFACLLLQSLHRLRPQITRAVGIATAGTLLHSFSRRGDRGAGRKFIFNAVRDGAVGKFIHSPQANPDDGPAGPVIGKGQANPQAVHGGAYAPYVIERWTKLQGS
jgi:hypothetical protein